MQRTGVGAYLCGAEELEFIKGNFDDPDQEWRRLFSEILGTFFLVLVGAGGAVVSARFGDIGRGAAVTAPGLMVFAIILFMGAVGGAHLNPAVSIAFALRGDPARSFGLEMALVDFTNYWIYLVGPIAGRPRRRRRVDPARSGRRGVGMRGRARPPRTPRDA